MNRIICIGNRFQESDSAGPRVYDRLAVERLPPGVEAVDGGTGGLNLLSLAEGCGRVIFVDCVEGFAGPGETVVLDRSQAEASLRSPGYHGTDLSGLLRVLAAACDGLPPEVLVIGIEPPAGDAAIAAAAQRSLALALGEEAWP